MASYRLFTKLTAANEFGSPLITVSLHFGSGAAQLWTLVLGGSGATGSYSTSFAIVGSPPRY